ncbi:hypothetical protein Emag_006694 [Eimeria magna]
MGSSPSLVSLLHPPSCQELLFPPLLSLLAAPPSSRTAALSLGSGLQQANSTSSSSRGSSGRSSSSSNPDVPHGVLAAYTGS